MAFDPHELDRDYGAPSGVITEAQYTTRTFLWMMLGLMVTFGVALVGWMTNGPGVKFCVSDFRQSQEWRWKAGRILA